MTRIARTTNNASHRAGVTTSRFGRNARLLGAGVVGTPLALAGVIALAGGASAHGSSGYPSANPSPSVPASAPAAICPTDGTALSNISYTANGVAISGLYGNVQAGDTVGVDFTVAPGCDLQVSLAAYTAASGSYVDYEAPLQQLYGTPATGTFTAGSHHLSVTAPSCYFQVDFIRGAAAASLTPYYYNNLGELLGSANGGTTSCSAPVVTPSAPVVTPSAPVVTPSAPVVTPSAPVVTPSAPVVTPTTPVVLPSQPTTPIVTPTTPTKVLGITITKAPAKTVVAVKAVTEAKPAVHTVVAASTATALPFTGSNTPALLEAAAGLIGAGVGLRLLGRRGNRSKI